MQDKVFSLIWHSNKWGCLKFMYKAPQHTTPNQITLNQATGSQTMASITKSREISALLRHYILWSGNSLPMFWDNLSVPLSRVKKSTRENRAQLKLTDTIFFFETVHCNFLKKRHASEARSVSIYRQRST